MPPRDESQAFGVPVEAVLEAAAVGKEKTDANKFGTPSIFSIEYKQLNFPIFRNFSREAFLTSSS